MGFCNEKNCSGSKRIRVNPDRIGVEGKGPGGRLGKHMEKGGPESAIFVPLKIRRQFPPCRGPMADELSVLGCSGGGKMGDARINPSNRIGDIGAIHGDLITNKEILRHVFPHPFAKLKLLFSGPSAIPYFPYLKRGFLRSIREGESRKEENEKSHDEAHDSILRTLLENCQQGR